MHPKMMFENLDLEKMAQKMFRLQGNSTLARKYKPQLYFYRWPLRDAKRLRMAIERQEMVEDGHQGRVGCRWPQRD